MGWTSLIYFVFILNITVLQSGELKLNELWRSWLTCLRLAIAFTCSTNISVIGRNAQCCKNRLQIEFFDTLHRHLHKYSTVLKQLLVSKLVLGIAGSVERLVSLRFFNLFEVLTWYWSTSTLDNIQAAHDLGPYSLNVAYNSPINGKILETF